MEGSRLALGSLLGRSSLSPTGRVSTQGALRQQASAAAGVERATNPSAYAGMHAGHVPDTTWTGSAQPHSWEPLSPRVNTSIGGQANGYPVGFPELYGGL